MNFTNCWSLLAGLGMLGMGVFVQTRSINKSDTLPFFTHSVFAFIYIFFSGFRDHYVSSLNFMGVSPESVIIPFKPIEFFYAYSTGYLAFSGGIFLSAAIAHFALRFSFPFSRFDKWFIALFYGVSVFFWILTILEMAPIGPNYNLYFDPGLQKFRVFTVSFFGVYSIYIALIVLFTLFVWTKKIMDSRSHPDVSQLRVLGLSSFFYLISVFIFNVIYPYFKLFHYTWIGRGAFVVNFISMFIAVTRFRAFNIKTAVHHTLYWFVISVLVFVPFYGLIVLLMPWIQLILGASISTVRIFGVILGFSSLIWAYFQWVQPMVNQRFFRRKFELKQLAVNFAGELAQIQDVAALVEVIRSTFKRYLYVMDVDLVLVNRESGDFEERTELGREYDRSFLGEKLSKAAQLVSVMSELEEPFSVSVMIPLRIQDELIGAILVGEKPSLKPFDSEELYFMNRISHQTAVFLNNAILFDDLKRKNEELVALQDELVSSEQDKARIEQKRLHTQELARGIIHEVKNTHLAVSNFVSLILNKTLNDPVQVEEVLNVIGEQSSKLHLFSTNYLQHELHKSNLVELRRFEVKVNAVIESAILANHFFIELNHLTIVNEVPDETMLEMDQDQMHLVVSNIINNAATHLKHNELRISVLETDEGVGCLRFCSKIEPASRGVERLSTGFGLKVMDYVVKLHGWKLKIEREMAAFLVEIWV